MGFENKVNWNWTGKLSCHCSSYLHKFLVFLLWQVTLVDKVEISLYVLSSFSDCHF